jgi:effector-binding domain-containing protein
MFHRGLLYLGVILLATILGCSFPMSFDQTPVGRFEVKTLPAATVMVTATSGDYFDKANGLFMTLFRYIRKQGVDMTVPVEGHHAPAQMNFYMSSRDQGRGLPDAEGVQVRKLPERTVASYGVRGSYTRENYLAAIARLRDWLKEHPEYSVTGEPYAVYWNGPYVPGFLKRFEVHIPVSLPQSAECVFSLDATGDGGG